jgi:competence ComEA-like helix-hairpin-helix protein
MALLDLEAGALGRAGVGKSGVTSPRSGGGTPAGAPAASEPRGLIARLSSSVWTKVLAKCAGVGVGMLALAALGASSLGERGTPVAVRSAEPRAAGMLGAVAARSSDARPLSVPSAAPPTSDGGAPREASSDAITADGKVILNRADETALCRLPGIGKKRAQAILALRDKLGGRFKNVSQLLRVKGIGPKALAKLTPHVVLDAEANAGDAGAKAPK